jgi:peptide deformylase
MFKVLQLGHPVLRAKAEPISSLDAALNDLAHDMVLTMRSQDGCGLAGNQIGVARRIVVVDVSGVKGRPSVLRFGGKSRPVRKHMPLILLNPELEALGETLEIGGEGCLSIPGIYGEVERPAGIRVRALDLEGNPLEFEAEGFLARALQHEVDHLNGVLFIDLLDQADRQRVAEEWQEISAESVG